MEYFCAFEFAVEFAVANSYPKAKQIKVFIYRISYSGWELMSSHGCGALKNEHPGKIVRASILQQLGFLLTFVVRP